MKKTLNVNLNGRVFTIDEDAYQLLDNYLSNLRICFRKEEGVSDIIADFEARIEELFSEKTRLGYQVITLEYVEEVITRVGKPADFADSEEKEEEKQTPKNEPEKGKKILYRNMDDKMIGGVCSGIAAYLDWDVVAIRIIMIVFLFTIAPFCALAYLIAWAIVPPANTAEEKLQMYGKPVTVENIGKTVAASTPVASKEQKGCLGAIVDLFVSFLKVCLAGLGCLVGLPLLFALFIVIIVLIAVLLGVGGSFLGFHLPFLNLQLVEQNSVLSIIAGSLVIIIPVMAITYSIIAQVFKWKPLRQLIKWLFLLIWILALVMFFSFGLKIDRDWHNNKWKWSSFFDYNDIRGNGIPSHKTIDFEEAVTSLEIGRSIVADFQIEQTQNETPSIEISGYKNLVEQVKYELRDGRLVLSSHNSRQRGSKNLKIILRTNELKSIQMNHVGNIRMNRAFTGDELEVRIRGVGSFRADDLYVNSLTVRSEGVGSAILSGKADKASFETAGTSNINALDLLSNSVYARVNGVGSIQCNPVEYLEGHVNGVGSIIYKEEPKTKNVSTSGVGKIRKK